MKRGQVWEGFIERVDFPNKSIIPVEETTEQGEKVIRRVVVKGGVPGQKVSFSVKKVKRDKCQGRLREVLALSPWETAEKVCPRFDDCGGCSYQRLPYDRQLELKKNQVIKLVDAVYAETGIEKDYRYDGILGSPEPFGYRNKMEFSFGDEVKDGPLTLGLHKKGSFHDILDADDCMIVHADFVCILACVRDYCRENKIPHYNKRSHEGVLRHLLVRRAFATGELLAALVVSSQRQMDWSELTQQLQELPLEGELAGFLLVINDSLGDVVQSDRTEILFGRDWFTEEVLGLKFRVSVFSFFQTNTRGAEVLYTQARRYILGDGDVCGERPAVSLADKTVFDLYSGTGTIAQLIAPVAKKVIGVEIVEEAVEAARKNAAQNGLENCAFIAGDVLQALDGIEDKPDYIILDPPRDGIHPKALQKIIAYGVEHIVYISCKPTSLARDLAVLEENGYHMERMCNVDMFPQTVHMETVCLLTKPNVERHIEWN